MIIQNLPNARSAQEHSWLANLKQRWSVFNFRVFVFSIYYFLFSMIFFAAVILALSLYVVMRDFLS